MLGVTEHFMSAGANSALTTSLPWPQQTLETSKHNRRCDILYKLAQAGPFTLVKYGCVNRSVWKRVSSVTKTNRMVISGKGFSGSPIGSRDWRCHGMKVLVQYFKYDGSIEQRFDNNLTVRRIRVPQFELATELMIPGLV